MKGFIERIEEENVYVVFGDETFIYKVNDFSEPITIDMQVEIIDGKLKVSPPDEGLKKEIEEVTKKIFVTFKDRQKRKE